VAALRESMASQTRRHEVQQALMPYDELLPPACAA
jgi:hypothetical protein